LTADPLDINEDALAEDYAVPASKAGGFAWPIRILTGIAAIFMAAIAGVTFVDVTGRYVFTAPIPGGVEIIEFLLGLLIFSALPLVVVKNAHISVELFDGFMSEGFKRIREIIVLLGNAGVLGFITSRMWATGLEMAEFDEISLHLQIETAPLLFALAGLSAMSVLTQLYMVWMLVTRRGASTGGDH
jgi:TRAP-type C4-dicarboxylate transport system permease small subunit